MTQDLTELVHAAAEEFMHLAALAADAESVQWESAPVPRPREDTSERISGEYSDPTPATTLDGRRLAVRADYLRAVRSLEEARNLAATARSQLTAAIERWEGRL